MPLIRVKKNFQVTIPTTLRKTLRIAVGDYLEVERLESELILKPVKLVHPDQAYFFTKEWQEGEARADKEIAQGEVLGPFDDIKKGLKALKTAKI